METNKIYCKLGESNPDELPYKIQGYFICFAKEPKYRAMGCNFNESKDFENAVVIDSQYLDLIHIGFSMVINGQFIENKEAFENSLKNIE